MRILYLCLDVSLYQIHKQRKKILLFFFFFFHFPNFQGNIFQKNFFFFCGNFCFNLLSQRRNNFPGKKITRFQWIIFTGGHFCGKNKQKKIENMSTGKERIKKFCSVSGQKLSGILFFTYEKRHFT